MRAIIPFAPKCTDFCAAQAKLDLRHSFTSRTTRMGSGCRVATAQADPIRRYVARGQPLARARPIEQITRVGTFSAFLHRWHCRARFRLCDAARAVKIRFAKERTQTTVRRVAINRGTILPHHANRQECDAYRIWKSWAKNFPDPDSRPVDQAADSQATSSFRRDFAIYAVFGWRSRNPR